MSEKVWLSDIEVGKRFGTTRQWVWTQARVNPKFPKPVKMTHRWTRWNVAEIEKFEKHLLSKRDLTQA